MAKTAAKSIRNKKTIKTSSSAIKPKRAASSRSSRNGRSGFFREKPLALLIVPLVVIVGVGSLLFARAATDNGSITGVGGLCLDIAGGKFASNAKLVLDTCSSASKTQSWTIPGDGTIRSNSYCLSDKDGSKAPETHARVEPCNGASYQKWRISPSGAIVSTSANLCLEDRDGLAKSGNDVWLNTCTNSTAQIWSIPKGASSTTSSPTPPTTTTGTLPNSDTILNFSNWELQEPVASGSGVLTIPSSKLIAGYSDHYIYTSSTPNGNAVTFFTPLDGAHTANSSYPRTELRELNPNGSDASWNMVGTNSMSATLEATDITGHTVIGQVHIGSPLPGVTVASSTKPLLELYYYANGNLVTGLEKSPSGSQTTTMIGNIPLGTKFTYAIQVSGDTVTIKLNNNAPVVLTASSSFNAYGMYFKAGDYLQTTGTSATVGAHVEFYSVTVQH